MCGCDRNEIAPTDTPAKRAKNLILISVDTLRAGRLGCYGYDRPTSPAIDAFAARGARFDTVIAECSFTLPSTLTIFTGRPPTAHGVTQRTGSLSNKVPVLGRILRAASFRSFGYTAGGFVRGWRGFARGFEEYTDKKEDLRTVLGRAEKRIAGLPEESRYCVFIHTYDVHCPYDPPPEYVRMLQTNEDADRIPVAGICGNRGEPSFNSMDLTPGQGAFLSDQYDAGVRWADDALREFFAFLDARNELDDTLVVLVSDHGDEFLEHGRIGHQGTLFIECLRVPLIIVGPGIDPQVITSGAGLADVLPTVLRLLGVEQPPGVLGRDLSASFGAQSPEAQRVRFSELSWNAQLRSVYDWPYHFIANVEVDSDRDLRITSTMLFDLRSDPTEQNDLAAQLTDRTAQYADAVKT